MGIKIRTKIELELELPGGYYFDTVKGRKGRMLRPAIAHPSATAQQPRQNGGKEKEKIIYFIHH